MYVHSSGTGYIGSFTALALLEAGYKVVITDNLYNSSAEVVDRIELICGKRPEFEKLDITDEKAVDALFDKHPDIDSVIHFAALKVRIIELQLSLSNSMRAPKLIRYGLRPSARAQKSLSTTTMSMSMAVSVSSAP